ncbi:condensation domain-containing protein [Streptomyces yangpuensis]
MSAHGIDMTTAGAALSYAQERLWFLDQLAPGTGLAHLPTALRLTGALDEEALGEAVTRLVTRHGGLRTGYGLRDGRLGAFEPQTPPPPVRLSVRDLSALGASQREETLRALLDQEARRPFPLADGTVLRASLFRLGETEHVLVLTVHRIACDDWSLTVLLDELATLYQALTTGGRPSPEPPGATASDHAAWQRAYLESAEGARNHWLERLASLPDEPAVPADRERPMDVPYETEQVRFSFPRGLRAELRTVAERHRVTPYIVLLTAFQLAAARRSGRQDVAVGTPTAGRTRVEFERVVGALDNMLVLRTDLSDAATLGELLHRVRAVVLDAYDHQDVPFEWLTGKLVPRPAVGRHPLVQTLFVHQGAAAVPRSLGALDVEGLDIGSRPSVFDLVFAVEDHGSEPVATIQYATSLFDRATVEELATDYLHVLGRLVADQDEPVSSLAAAAGPGVSVRPVVTGMPRASRARRESLADVQATILGVWRELLGGDEPIGPDDNFFDVGGHSHLLVQELSLLQGRVSAQLRIVDFFRHPTPRTLAAYIVEEAPTAADTPGEAPARAVPAAAVVPEAPEVRPEPATEPESHHSTDRREQLRRQRARRKATSGISQREERDAG